MNDSDTDFVDEDKSVFLLISLEKQRSVTKVALYQFQKQQSIFFLPKLRMKPILQVRINRIPLLPLNIRRTSYLLLPINVLTISHLQLPINVLPISYLLLPLNVLPINHLLLPINVLSISHLLLLLLVVLPISHPNLLLLPQLLYPKTPRNGGKA